jgi:hypothetical protein
MEWSLLHALKLCGEAGHVSEHYDCKVSILERNISLFKKVVCCIKRNCSFMYLGGFSFRNLKILWWTVIGLCYQTCKRANCPEMYLSSCIFWSMTRHPQTFLNQSNIFNGPNVSHLTSLSSSPSLANQQWPVRVTVLAYFNLPLNHKHPLS